MSDELNLKFQQRLDWARDTLEVDESSSAQNVRSKFLRQLGEEGFVPYQANLQAFLTLQDEFEGIVDHQDPEHFLFQQEQDLAEQVDAFAAEMFRDGPVKRREHWTRLNRMCTPFERPRARLGALASGLDLDKNQFYESNLDFHRLANYLCKLHALRMQAKAEYRDEILSNLEKEREKWETIAKDFHSQHPEWVTLDPGLIRHLATWSQVNQKIESNSRREYTPEARYEPVPTADSNFNYGWVIFVAVIAGSLLSIISKTSKQNQEEKIPKINFTLPELETPVVPPTFKAEYTPSDAFERDFGFSKHLTKPEDERSHHSTGKVEPYVSTEPIKDALNKHSSPHFESLQKLKALQQLQHAFSRPEVLLNENQRELLRAFDLEELYQERQQNPLQAYGVKLFEKTRVPYKEWTEDQKAIVQLLDLPFSFGKPDK